MNFTPVPPLSSLPLATAPFHSYRYQMGHGYIMVGAMDDADALAQVKISISPSIPAMEYLQRHDGDRYRDVV